MLHTPIVESVNKPSQKYDATLIVVHKEKACSNSVVVLCAH